MPPPDPPELERVALHSKSIISVGYAADLRILEAEFASGEIYRFFMVPESVYRALIASESKGAYFQESIRALYPFAKLGAIPETHDDTLLSDLEKSLATLKKRSDE
jgi:hypothetical protein